MIEVETESFAPFRVRDVEKRLGVAAPYVVHENIDAAEFIERLAQKNIGYSFLRHVTHNTRRTAASQRVQFIDGLVQALLSPRANRHVTALAHQILCDMKAEAPAGRPRPSPLYR